MSAECHKHGTDLVYPDGSWPIGVCPVCEVEATQVTEEDVRRIVREEFARTAKAVGRAALDDFQNDPRRV